MTDLKSRKADLEARLRDGEDSPILSPAHGGLLP